LRRNLSKILQGSNGTERSRSGIFLVSDVRGKKGWIRHGFIYDEETDRNEPLFFNIEKYSYRTIFL